MAEGGGLLNRYTVNSRIGGSNPPPSANYSEYKSNFNELITDIVADPQNDPQYNIPAKCLIFLVR